MSDKNTNGTENRLSAKEKFVSQNRIDIDYRVENDRVIIGRKSYRLPQIATVYMVVLFLSVMLIILSVMRIFRKDYLGIVFVFLGIIGFAIGMLYRYIYKKAKAVIDSRKQEVKNVSNDG